MKELQSLGLDVKVMDEHDNEIEMADVEDEDTTERKVDLQQKMRHNLNKKKLLISQYIRYKEWC